MPNVNGCQNYVKGGDFQYESVVRYNVIRVRHKQGVIA